MDFRSEAGNISKFRRNGRIEIAFIIPYLFSMFPEYSMFKDRILLLRYSSMHSNNYLN
jgi:predicted unusual protein kinase regulating ubiquinone biosynthesis (AarF/ABC1/UbiB family)